MEVKVKGQVYKTGKTKNNNFYCNMLIPRADGSSDNFTLFSKKEYKLGENVDTTANAFVQMASEVDQPVQMGAKK